MSAHQLRVVFAVSMTALVACGDDNDSTQDMGPPSHDVSRPRDQSPTQDGARDGPPSSGFFKIQGVIDFDPKMCQSTNPQADCQGPLVWGVWTKPLTAKDPGPPLYINGVLGAKKGTAFSADQVPIAPKMYLSAFVDDDNNATMQNPWPDKGDPLHVDLEPFSATPGQTVTRNVNFWARMP